MLADKVKQNYIGLSLREFFTSLLAAFIWFTPVRVLLLFLFLQPFLEFTRNQELNYIKHILLRLITLYVFIYTVFYSFQSSGRSGFLLNRLKYPIILYSGSAFISLLLAYWNNNLDFSDAIISIVTLPILISLLYVIPFWVDNKESLIKFVKVFLFSGFVVVLIGFFQMLFFRDNQSELGFRITSVFHDPNIFGRFLLIGIFFILSLLFYSKEKIISKKILILLLILTSLNLLFSLSRSSYGTFVVGSILFAFFSKSKKIRYSIIISALLIGTASFIFLFSQRTFYGTLITEPSNFNRIQVILGGIEMIKDNWLWGIGYTNFGYVFANSVQSSMAVSLFYYEMMGYQTSIHNWLIEVWAEQGIIGLIGYIWFFYIFIKILLDTKKSTVDKTLQAILIGFLLMFFVFLFHGFFYHTFISQFFFWVMAGFSLAAANAAKKIS